MANKQKPKQVEKTPKKRPQGRNRQLLRRPPGMPKIAWRELGYWFANDGLNGE